MHFLPWHVRETVVILKEGKIPHQRCPCCDMLLPWAALNVRHPNAAQCAKSMEQNRGRLAEEEMRAIMDTDFQSYGRPLTSVSSFNYLGQVLTS